ncbi:MAG: primase, partial [Brevibacillus sp.]|nr:primase [Brevibacillus sp.]
MAGPTSDEFVNQVRAAVDIVDVVGEYVQLRKSGR